MSIDSSKFQPMFEALPPKAKRRVRQSLFHWFQWSKTTTYKKISAQNLNRAEAFFIYHILRDAAASQDQQLMLDFDWRENSPKCGR